MAAFQQRICNIVIIALIGIHISVINATRYQVKLAENYFIHYELKNNTIDFNIKVVGVTGWVGIGLNADRSDMIGADIYMGGYNKSAYGKNYIGTSNSRPTESFHLYWKTNNASEVDGTTRINVTRLIDNEGNDDKHYVPIENKTIHLIWAYNQKSDNTSIMHTHKGHKEINFYEKPPPPSPPHSGINRMQCGLTSIVFVWVICACHKLCFQFS